MQTCTYTLAEVHIINGFMSHTREFDEVEDAIEYCKHLCSHNILFDIYDPEMVVRFNQDDLNSIEEYFELDQDDQRNVWFLMEYQDQSLDDALKYYDEVINYGGTSREELIEEKIRNGCYGDISDTLFDFLDWERLVENFGDECYDTAHGLFSY
ncbi:MAG: hypothetical protein K8S87_10520 [Planctomycetes bacterium]|nr:hypothetical protein [Planctomycetota bacterium]